MASIESMPHPALRNVLDSRGEDLDVLLDRFGFSRDVVASRASLLMSERTPSLLPRPIDPEPYLVRFQYPGLPEIATGPTRALRQAFVDLFVALAMAQPTHAMRLLELPGNGEGLREEAWGRRAGDVWDQHFAAAARHDAA